METASGTRRIRFAAQSPAVGHQPRQAAVDAKTNPYRMVNDTAKNAADLERELTWFAAVLELRLKLHFGNANGLASVFEITPPDLSESDSPYAQFLRHYELTFSERIVLLLALVPLVRPQLLDVLWSRNDATNRGFTEFGGVHGATHGGFIPTGET